MCWHLQRRDEKMPRCHDACEAESMIKTGTIESEAFRHAALRSERIRIVGTVVIFVILGLFIVLRALWARTGAEAFFGGALLTVVLIAYEGGILAIVNRSIHRSKALSPRFWVLNVVVETTFPSMGIIYLSEAGVFSPYAALVAPPVLTYFFFIILSTLRLRPLLSLLAGLSSASGYLLAAAYVSSRYPADELGGLPVGVPLYTGYATAFCLGGLVAAGVARQIRQHVSAALDEAHQVERHRADLEIARSIQQALLPKDALDVTGYEVAGWTKPAEQTGGDCYDWLVLPDGRVAVFLADVSGHGIGAAMVTANCHAYVRASVAWHEDQCAAMNHLNRLLADDLPVERFVTFAAATLDANQHRVELLSAGHGPLLLYKAEKHAVIEYRAQGIPLGVMPETSYGQPHDIRMAPGDMLVLVTDGITEWASANGEMFGLNRLKAFILDHVGLAPNPLIEKLHQEVIGFASGTAQLDDLTVVVLRRPSGG
jgi:serine phosphatase RsbU (regulator of sigma subunit)